MKISACIIAKNEEKKLNSTLIDISDVVDEIIFVDTGSSDKTKNIASKFTNKIYDFKWIDDFSAARNFADSKANFELIMTWDCDWLFKMGKEKLINEVKSNRNFDSISCLWHADLDKNHNPLSSYFRPIIYKKNYFKWVRPIHNQLSPIKQNFRDLQIKEVEINHFKEVDNNPRYWQSIKIMQKYQNDHPEDLEIAIFLSQSLKKQNELNLALDVLQKAIANKVANKELKSVILELLCVYLIEKNDIELAKQYFKNEKHKVNMDSPRMCLLEADLFIFEDLEKSIQLYQNFINICDQKLALQNHKRYYLHPRKMLGII